MQKYKVVHSKRVVNHTQRYDGAVHKLKTMAARLSCRKAVEQRGYAAGMADTRVDSLKLACTRIENTHKVRKETFVFAVFMWLLFVQLLGGQNRYAFV